jgi:hypothetical protein
MISAASPPAAGPMAAAQGASPAARSRTLRGENGSVFGVVVPCISWPALVLERGAALPAVLSKRQRRYRRKRAGTLRHPPDVAEILFPKRKRQSHFSESDKLFLIG